MRKKIFFLDYVYEFEDGHDDIRLLGVFSSREKVKLTLSKIKNNPEFKKIAKHIVISDDVIDRLGWTEGYVRVF